MFAVTVTLAKVGNSTFIESASYNIAADTPILPSITDMILFNGVTIYNVENNAV